MKKRGSGGARGREKSRFIKFISRSMSNVDSFTLNNKFFSLFLALSKKRFDETYKIVTLGLLQKKSCSTKIIEIDR